MNLVPQRMQFPLEETYWAFGDGSEVSEGVFYGLVLFPEAEIEQVLLSLERVKVKHGGQAHSSVHCRELFNRSARDKSEWKHLTEAQVEVLCGDVLREIAQFRPKHLLGFLPRKRYPKRFRLIGKNGHRDLVHDVNSKWLTLWAFFRIAGLLDPAKIIEPSKGPRPNNLPSWQMMICRTERGLRVSKVFLDREQTKVRWFSKSLQWISMAKDFVVEGPLGKSHLPIEADSFDKHPLLDVADVFTYSAGRHLTKKPMNYAGLETEIHLETLNFHGDEMILGKQV